MSAEIAAKPAAAAPAKKEKNPVVYWVGVVAGLFLMFVFGRVCPAWGAGYAHGRKHDRNLYRPLASHHGYR